MVTYRPARRRALTFASAAALAAAVMAPAAPALADAPDDSLGNAADYGAKPNLEHGLATHSPTGAWFVELAGKPTARGGNATANAGAAAELEESAEDLGVEMEVRHTFDTLWNGLSVDVSDDGAAALAETDDVVAVYPVLTFDAPEPASTEKPEMASAVAMTGADVAQSELGFTGKGIRVGIIDTGVDFDHPDLGGTGTDGGDFPTERVAFGHDFVGDSYNADPTSPDYQPVPNPDPVPDDCAGHGTHVAGIVGAGGDPAEGGVRGVAPGVTFGAYRVFGCEGSTTSDIMVAAMEQALQDGMDVVNQSIGSAFADWPQYPTAVASDNLVAAGVTMVASIGNEGDLGLYAAGAPGVGRDVIGVASYDNTTFTANTVDINGHQIGYNTAEASPEAPKEGQLEVVAAGEPGTVEGTACAPLEELDGQAVLIERGAVGDECEGSFYSKAIAAQEAGAGAALIYNTEPGLLNPTVEGDEKITIPVIFIGMEEGRQAVADAADGATLTWTDETASMPNPTGGLISDFSSFGLAADLSLKPDLGAPGGSIWSTLPLEENGGYGSNSGTSMASPHVAGAAALMLQAHPDLTPGQVREQFQNTAEPSLFSFDPSTELLEQVNRQGAGLLQVDTAILATTSVSPGKISLGESEHGPVTETLTVTNTGEEEVTYEVSSEDAVSTGENPEWGDSPDVPGFYADESQVQAPETVTVPAGGSTSFEVTISPSEEYDLVQYGGYIHLTSGEETLSVPYAGYAGDYQSVDLLTEGDVGFPVLGKLTSCNRFDGVDCINGGDWDIVEGGTYSMADGDVPTLLVHLEHPAQSLQIDIYKANADGSKGDPVHPLSHTYLEEDYLGRSGGPNQFDAYTWDGTRPGIFDSDRDVPDGDYVLELSAVNALGDPDTAEDVETYTSPAFTVDRDGDGNPPPPSFIDIIKKLFGAFMCWVMGYCPAP